MTRRGVPNERRRSFLFVVVPPQTHVCRAVLLWWSDVVERGGRVKVDLQHTYQQSFFYVVERATRRTSRTLVIVGLHFQRREPRRWVSLLWYRGGWSPPHEQRALPGYIVMNERRFNKFCLVGSGRLRFTRYMIEPVGIFIDQRLRALLLRLERNKAALSGEVCGSVERLRVTCSNLGGLKRVCITSLFGFRVFGAFFSKLGVVPLVLYQNIFVSGWGWIVRESEGREGGREGASSLQVGVSVCPRTNGLYREGWQRCVPFKQFCTLRHAQEWGVVGREGAPLKCM